MRWPWSPPRGIIAAGEATSETYAAPNFDQERAEAGDQALRVDLVFERILDPGKVQPLSTETFSGSLAEVYWAMPASGVELPEDAAQQLEAEWENHVQMVDGGGDGEEEQEGERTAHRNPDWQRDELILALDLFFRHNPNSTSKTHPEVLALSELLNALPIHAHRAEAVKFRNPNSVYMKMCNFLRFDPSYQGVGLARGNRLEKEVWDQFANNLDMLSRVADAIKACHAIPEVSQIATEEDAEEVAFPEGRVLYRLHRARERNRLLVKKARKRALQQDGRLRCCVCKFDFEAVYGPVGEGFMECHHIKPLSELVTESETKLRDLALVCSNCHRMIHRKRPWLSIEELGDLLYRDK